ncbi:MAG TPA: thiamine pyrophosphate-dependent enzyme, partial [Solirubrobacteraceae bacterium]|nr:thiamine pyrophosphate-dependent enzyme [Solirubrobacteraceae bacterium]
RSEPRPDRAATGTAVAAWAARHGVPVLSDPLGGARRGPAAVGYYDALLRNEAFAAQVVPDLVVRVGDLPTSKPLRGWLAALPEETVHVGFDPAGAWHDPDGVLGLVLAADPAGALQGARADQIEEGWTTTWQQADAAAARALGETLGDEVSEPAVAARLLASLPAEAVLVVASSMPVRDVETFSPAREDPPRVLSNRGANGIDGTVSTALGVACAHPGPTVLLTGDVALVHDLGGLAACARAGLALTIVLVDNAGGGIFDFLPVAAAGAGYEQHVATPPRVDFAHAAATAGLAYRPVSSLEEIAPAEAPTLLHVRSERSANVELHRRCWAAVHRALYDGEARRGDGLPLDELE